MSSLQFQDHPADPAGYLPLQKPVTLDDIASFISVRTYNCLKREGLTFISEIAQRTEEELLQVRSLGQSGVDDLKAVLAKHGLSLALSSGDPVPGDQIDVEHVTVYRWGQLVVTVGGDGGGVISKGTLRLALTSHDMSALCQITERIKAQEDPDTSWPDQPTEVVAGGPGSTA